MTGARAAVGAVVALAILVAGPFEDRGRAAGRPGKASAPGYVVVDLPAIKRTLRDSRGHVVLVHFWATWCAPCLDELPMMERFAREAKPRGVEVLSLSLDDPDRAGALVARILSEVAPTLTRSIVRIDDADLFIGSFEPWEGAIPAVFAYDAAGQLRGQIVGEASRRELEDLVGRALKPAPARSPRMAR